MSYPYQIKTLEAYHEAYKNSIDHPEKFWGAIAENFTWRKKWDKVLDWNLRNLK
jgi:acetyl-CoA synthetase